MLEVRGYMSQDTAAISEAWISYEAYLLEFTFARTGVFVFHFNFVLFWTFPLHVVDYILLAQHLKEEKGPFFSFFSCRDSFQQQLEEPLTPRNSLR